MFNGNLLQQASVEELRKGFVFQGRSKEFICLFCGLVFKKGVIHKQEDLLLDSELAMEYHIRKEHDSSFAFLTDLDKRHNGLSPIQKEILPLLYEGLPDTEIAGRMDKAHSTIRNHRFTLKEKYKEAKVFMAIMEELFEKRERPEDEFVKFHASLTVNDDRTKITEKEKYEILNKYFVGDRLKSFPKKQKRKLILLQHIARMFDPEKIYTEREVNDILLKVQDDYVTIRRYLIEYGFMDRKSDGSRYWILK